VDIRLLGRPAVVIDGLEAAPPRGVKAWGLLAFLAVSERPRSRSELADLLFARAEDPLGALRWSLAALRRLLDQSDVLKGDQLALDLSGGAAVDVHAVERGDSDAVDLPGFGQELLAGLSFPDSPLFETWLLGERRRLAVRSASLLREAALSRSARGDHDEAIRYASRLVGLDPLDEGHQALLIRAHALAGDADAASMQLETCRRVLRSELGCEPGPAVVAAARAAESTRRALQRTASSEGVEARLSVAWQSFLGGAIDHALDLGRGAVTSSDDTNDDYLRTITRTFLAAMLGIAVRGWDEAATALSEAFYLAEQLQLADDAATVLAVRSGTEMMRGDYQTAHAYGLSGLEMSHDPGARALNLMFLGGIEADRGKHDQAAQHAESAVSSAEDSRDPVRLLYASAHAARVLLMCDQPSRARPMVELARATGTTMLAIQPWPVAMLAEVEVADGQIEAALRHAKQAEAMSATTGVSYQQALAKRAMGLAEAARGDTDAAIGHLTAALNLARRTTGEGYTFHWPVAFILESLTTVTAKTDPTGSRRWASTLLDHASAIQMDHFVTRARQHLEQL
jgi:DNA-binding SARP family transcriptional activator